MKKLILSLVFASLAFSQTATPTPAQLGAGMPPCQFSIFNGFGILLCQSAQLLKTATGTITAAGDTVIVPALPIGTMNTRVKVLAYEVSASVPVTFKDGAGGVALWTPAFLSPGPSASNLSTTAPSFLFGTSAGNGLVLNVSAAGTVTYSISYWQNDSQ